MSREDQPGLPDGRFSNTKIPILVIFLEVCNGRGWYILWPFGRFVGYLLYFPQFCRVFPRKIWQP
jgi:hypothetical protein